MISTGILAKWGNVLGGSYEDANGNSHGFTERGGVFTTIDEPNSASNTSVQSIYRDALAGAVEDANGIEHGFIETSGVYTTTDVPRSSATQVRGVTGYSHKGITGYTLVGVYADGNGQHGFIAHPK